MTILPEIPKGPTGKIQRRNLAALVDRVKVAVVGAGAIGAYVGAALYRGGADVHLMARGEHLEAMRRDGVTVLSPRGDFRAHPHATSIPAEIGPVDIVFLGLKAYSYAGCRAAARAAAAAGHRRGRRAERHPVVVLPRTARPLRRPPRRGG